MARGRAQAGGGRGTRGRDKQSAGAGKLLHWLDERVAVVTGAGTGIGAAVAERFVAEGARVVLVGRRPGPLRAVAAGLGERALTIPADAASATDMADMAATAAAR